MRAPPDSAALESFGNRRAVVTLVVLLSVVLLSRVLLFPASVWEQDEAYFAAAVVEVDVADSRPHAPFFPLWIGLGKVLFLMGVPPADALQFVSSPNDGTGYMTDRSAKFSGCDLPFTVIQFGGFAGQRGRRSRPR